MRSSIMQGEASMSRRQFVQASAIGGTLALTHQLCARAQPSVKARPKIKSVIFVYLHGGPSHLDTYDLKPNAPKEIRGEFQPIATNVPGIAICEHMPLQASMFDKFALLRAVVARETEHVDIEVMTGHLPAQVRAAGHPNMGSVISRMRGMVAGVPAFVSLRPPSPGCEPGFLGSAYRPFLPTGPTSAGLRLPAGVTQRRVATRMRLLETLETAAELPAAAHAKSAIDTFRHQAVDMIASGNVRRALDFKQEPAHVVERYRGVEAYLAALRLIEAGAGFVTIGEEPGSDDWDTHFVGAHDQMRRLMNKLDRGLSALVGDLHARGLADDCLVLAMGEMGRTPRINDRGGRDHWPQVMSAVLAGAGIRTGQVIGASTSRGEATKDGACTVSQVLASVYRAIGIEPSTVLEDRNDRPIPLLDDHAPIPGLLA